VIGSFQESHSIMNIFRSGDPKKRRSKKGVLIC
jgi:hypothetical protein